MDFDDFVQRSADDQIDLIRGELGLVQALWTRESAFKQLWDHALGLLTTSHAFESRKISARALLDTTYLHLVARPTDLMFLADGHSQLRALWLLKDYARHPLARNDVISGLAKMPEMLTRLPRDAGWLEVVVLVYGMRRLNLSPGRRFSVDQLIPLGIDADRSASRAVLASALENDQLLADDVRRLTALFPDDKYFSRMLQSQ